jgi:acetyltransferase-like isoleucine patch superfamily enzyme
MGFGIFRRINSLYINYLIYKFWIRAIFFGFENANIGLKNIDKRAIIPILKKFGATIGRNCDIESHLIIHNCKNYVNLEIGNNCHLGKEVFLDLEAPIILEDSVTISMRSTILTHVDVGKSELKNRNHPYDANKVVLKKGCYLGANTTVLHGITVGEYAVVGASALVIKDVPAYSVAGGIPAKKIKDIN